MKIPQYGPTTGRWICRVGIADIMLLAHNTDCVYGIESKVETGDGSEFFSFYWVKLYYSVENIQAETWVMNSRSFKYPLHLSCGSWTL